MGELAEREIPACAGADPRLFDWEENNGTGKRTEQQLFAEQHAKAYCRICPVMMECRQTGLEPQNLNWVILGGLNPAERRNDHHGRKLAERRAADRERRARSRVSV